MLARSNWQTFVTALLHRETNMALYYLLLRGWIHIGHSEWFLRLLSVVFAVSTIPLMYLLAQAFGGTRNARIAAFLMSINAFHIQYSQEARGYTLVVFLALLSCYLFWNLPDAGKIPVQYILVSVFMVYAHIFGVWILMAQWVSILFVARRSGTRKTFGIAAGTIAVLIAPLFFSVLFVSDRSQLSWMKMNKDDLASALYHFFIDLSGNGGLPLLVLYLVLLIVSLGSYFRDLKAPVCRESIPYLFLWIWLLFPPVVVGAISLYQPVFQPRYLIFCLPPFLILVADGMAHIRSRPIFIAALLVTAGMSFFGVDSYYKWHANMNYADNWRDATAYCISQAQPGDAVLFTYSAEEIPFREYEYRFAGANADMRLVPPKTDIELLSTTASWTSPELASSTAYHSRQVWVISALEPNEHSAAVETALRLHLNEQSRRSFGFVVAKVFGPPNT
jgi:uncharacterized membrane protein